MKKLPPFFLVAFPAKTPAACLIKGQSIPRWKAVAFLAMGVLALSTAGLRADTLAPYGCWNNLGFEAYAPEASGWNSTNGTAVSTTFPAGPAHTGTGAIRFNGSASASLFGSSVSGAPVPAAGDTVGGYYWIRIESTPTATTLPDVQMTSYNYITGATTVYTQTSTVNPQTLPLNTWVKVDLQSAGNLYGGANSYLQYKVVAPAGLNCLVDDITFGTMTASPPGSSVYGIFDNLKFEDTPPIMSQWSGNGVAVSYINNTSQAHAGHGAAKLDGTAAVSIWGGTVAGANPPAAGDSVGGSFWIKILSAPATTFPVDVQMTGYDSANAKTVYSNTRPVDLTKIPLNTWTRLDLIPSTSVFNASHVANFNIVSVPGLNCLIDDVVFEKVSPYVTPAVQGYGIFGNLQFEDTPLVMSQWSANGTAVTSVNSTSQARTGHGAIKLDGTAAVSIWGGAVAGANPPAAGDSVGGSFWIKILSAPATTFPVDVQMIGYDSSNVKTVYCNTRPVDLTKIPLNTWTKVDIIPTTATFNVAHAPNFNIVSPGGLNCIIDDVTFGRVGGSPTPTPTPTPSATPTPTPTPPTGNDVDNAIEPPFQEYVGSTFNGNFEVGNSAVGNQYWGQYVPNQSAVAGSPNMINLLTSPAGTGPGNIKNGNNMIEVIRGGSAWNIAGMSSASTDKLPRAGDIVGGSYWIWVPANANLSQVPTVTFAYQAGDVVVADSSSFPASSLVKGKWNQVPLYPKANSAIPANATGAVILINAPQVDTTSNPLYASKYYIDEIRVGKIPAGIFFAKASSLVGTNGNPIAEPGASDTALNVKVVVQNSQAASATSTAVVLRLYEGTTLKSTTTQPLTVAAKGATGFSNTAASMSASLVGIDKTKLNARLHLYDAAQQSELMLPFSLVQKMKMLAASDPNIKYRGRWAASSGSSESNWIRPYFKTSFSGQTIRISLTKSVNLSVILDGVETAYTGANGNFELGANLPAGTHTLRVAGLTYPDRIFFDGLYIDDAGALSAPAMRPKHIEFIGDSITAWDNGYSWQVPEQLNVESSRIAWPGIALVDGFGYYKPVPPLYGMSSAFLKVGMPEFGSGGNWDFVASPYIPDVVVINLGTNDAAQITGVPSFVTSFSATYTAFIQTVRSKYPNAHIFVLKAFSIPYANVNTAVQNAAQNVINGGDAKVHYVDTTSWGVQIGSDGVHPTDAGHTTITSRLIPLVSPYLQ